MKFIKWLSNIPIHLLILLAAIVTFFVWFFWSNIKEFFLWLSKKKTESSGGTYGNPSNGAIGNYTWESATSDIRSLINSDGIFDNDESIPINILTRNNGAQNRYLAEVWRTADNEDVGRFSLAPNYQTVYGSSLENFIKEFHPQILQTFLNNINKQP